MTRPIAAALLLALAPLASTPPLRAQGATEDPTTATARARFKEGVDFYDKGDFEQARTSFLQAYALKKHPAVLLNLAWSCVKSGHALEAERYFKQFLAEGKDITDKQRADATDGLAQSRAKLARIEIVAAAGTEVTVDGDRVGNVPLADPIVVEIGAHTVKFKAPDGATDTQSITVTGGEKAIARFKATTTVPAAVAPAPPPPVGPAASQEPTPPAPPPPPPPPKSRAPEEATGQRTPSSATGSRGAGLFAPPNNLVPVILLGTVAVLGYGGAGLFLFFKGQAQDKADSLAAEIKAKGGSCANPVRAPSPNLLPTFQAACDVYNTDISQTNDDATAGNVSLAVGIAATAGAIVYWLVADKQEDAHATASPILAPLVGPGIGGIMLSDRF